VIAVLLGMALAAGGEAFPDPSPATGWNAPWASPGLHDPAESRAVATDSVRPLTDSVTFPRIRADIPGLPLEVRRFRDSDLDTVPHAAAASSIAPALADTASTLKITGEKTLRVGVGGEGGVAVDQTLRLDAAGELAPGVQVKAHLSDQQVPLGSEGSTEALRELDEVYLQVKTKRWDMIVGDQDWSLADGATPGATRRLRGLSTGWEPSWQARATTGSPRAQWMRTTFTGVEGRQEGWILPGPEGRARAPVVPASERVSINGTKLQAGTDYTLRASEGVLDFLPRRRITSQDRIEVEWQAAVLDYQRSLTAAQGSSSDSSKHDGLRWEAWALRESDDPTRPLSFAANGEADSILRAAGSDPARAKRKDSTSIPLPRSQEDAGFRLGWSEGKRFDLGTEVRGTRINRNLASTMDPVIPGYAGAVDGSSRNGEALSQGGAGIVGTSLKLRKNDEGFQPISGRTLAGSAGNHSWNDEGGSTGGAAWETSGGLSWEAEQGLGVWTDGGQRQDSGALARRAEAKLGLQQGDRQILSDAAFARREESRRELDRWWTKETASWRLGWFVPRVATEGEDRQVGFQSEGISRQRWGSVLVGTAANGFDGRFASDLALQARQDQSDHGGIIPEPEDSLRSRGFRLESKWTDIPWTADGLLDGKLVEHKASASGQWVPDQTWLGETHVAAHPHPGLDGDARWTLSLSDFIPEIQVWDTVPPGTGTHKWDPVSHQVIVTDNGNLVAGGTRVDTTRPPIRSARRSLALEGTLEPGLVWTGLVGILADIGLHGRGEWEQADSSSTIQLLPDFDDAHLASSVEGRSALTGNAWWARSGHRLDISVERDWIVAGSTVYSPASTQRDLEWRSQYSFAFAQGHRIELPWKNHDRILSGQNLSRRETVNSLEPLVSLRVARPVDLRPSTLLAAGSGHDGNEMMTGSVVSPAFGVVVRLGRTGTARSEIRWAEASTTGPAGSNLTEGFLIGRTWRASSGLDWTIDKHFSASADWVLRIDPGQDPFQKASVEARAVF